MKLFLIVILLVIVLSLADAMYHLARGDGGRNSTRVVKALTVRIGLSLLLFGLLLLGAFFGFIEPHDVQP